MAPNPTILVVDDEPDIRELVRLHLAQEGYAVCEAESGERAIAVAAAERPALIMLDLMLPGADGFEVCRQLRQDDTLRGIPIIMLTARATEVDRVLGLELGADDYITKPFSPRELVARVRAVLRRATREDLFAVVALQRVAYAKNRAILGVEPLPLKADYAQVFADYEIQPGASSDAADVPARQDVLAFTLGGLSKSVGLPQAKLGWIAASGCDSYNQGSSQREKRPMSDGKKLKPQHAPKALHEDPEFLNSTPARPEELAPACASCCRRSIRICC